MKALKAIIGVLLIVVGCYIAYNAASGGFDNSYEPTAEGEIEYKVEITPQFNYGY